MLQESGQDSLFGRLRRSKRISGGRRA